MPIENELTVRWGGVEYRQSQLTAADMIAMEDEWGEAFLRIDFESMKAVCWLVWLIRRHDEPNLSLDDVTSITLEALAEDARAAVPPTGGSRKRASKSAKSGARTTARSSASDRGTSSS